LLATVAIAVGFGVWQAALRSEPGFGVGDPSVYLPYGDWVAQPRNRRHPPGLPAGAAVGARGRDVALRARRRAGDARRARRVRGAVVRRTCRPAGRGAVGAGR